MESTGATDDRASGLARSLGLRDVALLGIACIVGTRWLAAAAHAGPGSVTLFLLAGLLFVVPTARSVGVLAAKWPNAGGLYLWAREDFGQWHGFLAFLCYWLGIACWVPNAAMAYVSIVVYAIDPSLVEHRGLIVGCGAIAIWVGVGVNLLGVKVGRWNQNAGSMATWLMVLLLIGSAALVYLRQGSATVLDLRPPMGFDTLNFWSQIAFALTGVELLGMMAGEIRDPARTIARAGWLSGMAAVFIYCSATLAILVLLKPADTNVVFGSIQAAQVASTILAAPWMLIVFATLSALSMLGQFGGIVSATSRLSFAASLDGLLPPVIARVHPRWKTPHVSMLMLAGLSTLLLVVMQLGDTMRAAYQELISMMVLGSFAPFLYVFASAWKAGLRWAPISGTSVTLLALIFTVLPTEDIHNVWLFEAKIFGGSAILLAFGRWIYSYNLRTRGQHAPSGGILTSEQ